MSREIESNSMIRLNTNESFIRLKPEICSMIKSELTAVELNRYPDREMADLKKLYVDYIGEEYISEDNLMVGCGSDEILSFIIRGDLGEGKNMLILSPEFEMYEYYCNQVNGNVVKYEVGRDGKFNVEDFIEFGKSKDISLIVFSNPHNPTGHALSSSEIEKIVRSFQNADVVVDEAYYEFNSESAIKLIEKYSNLIVTRTLSKAWGLASARIGFMISRKKNIQKFMKYKSPYNINVLSKVTARVVLNDRKTLDENVNMILSEREKLYTRLKEIESEAALEIEFYESKANFIFGRTPYKDALFSQLNSENIIIRNFDDDSFRITIGSSYENDILVQCIKEVFVYGGLD